MTGTMEEARKQGAALPPKFVSVDPSGLNSRQVKELIDNAMNDVVDEHVMPQLEKKTRKAAQEYWTAHLSEMACLVRDNLIAKGYRVNLW